MAVTVAEARVELKKPKKRYKRNVDRRMGHGNARIEEFDYVWLDVQEGNRKEKLGRHREGPFEVLIITAGTLIIHRGKGVEHLSSDRDV